MTKESLPYRLRLHAHELVNGGTNAGDLRNALNEAADALLSAPTGSATDAPQEEQEKKPLAFMHQPVCVNHDGYTGSTATCPKCHPPPSRLTDASVSPSTTIHHEWKRTDKKTGRYDCQHCGMWTANMPLYSKDVCPARERRQVPDRRRHV